MLAMQPIRTKPWGNWPITDDSDFEAVKSVFQENCFTGFRAGNYDGGRFVKELESNVCKTTLSEYAISFDTWSNGILAILNSIAIRPGDEVILPAYTMTACASMILALGGVPIFVDIDMNSGCLLPDEVNRAVTDKTVAIMVVHLFGFAADMSKIMQIADNYGLWVIEDCAQAPFTLYKWKLCGTIGDVGGFSFTQNKHVMAGEGGCAITNNEAMNNSLRYSRNHGEVTTVTECSQDYSTKLIEPGIVGFNFRMTEMAAALANNQYCKLQAEVKHRQKLAMWLDNQMCNIPHLQLMSPDYLQNSSYFLYTVRYTGTTVSKKHICDALIAENIPVLDGYCKPIYRQNIYSVFPTWSLQEFGNSDNYKSSRFPNTEKLHNDQLIVFPMVRSPNTIEDMNDIVLAVKKIFGSF